MPWKLLIIDNNNGQGPVFSSRVYNIDNEGEARLAQDAQEFIDRGASVVGACVVAAVDVVPVEAPPADGDAQAPPADPPSA